MEQSINSVLKKYNSKDKGGIIPILQDVQKLSGFISPESVKKIGKYLKVSPSKIYGVATFYSQFRFNPPGRHSIKICLGTACHVRGGDFLLNALERELGISPGMTTDDQRFDLERVACLGCCALAPVLMVDDEIHSRVSVSKLKEVLEKYE